MWLELCYMGQNLITATSILADNRLASLRFEYLFCADIVKSFQIIYES